MVSVIDKKARARLRDATLDALAVVAPTSCSGCGRPDRALCDACLCSLRSSPFAVSIPRPDCAGELSVYCALDYGGAARRVLVALKDEGRTDAARALAPALAAAVRAACRTTASPSHEYAIGEPRIRAPRAVARLPPLELAAIPSTAAALRRRGYRPVERVAAHAGLRLAHPLVAARQTQDQAQLNAVSRRVNRVGSLRARRRLDGRAFLIVDDILTTGSTLLEAERALSAAGAIVFGAATIAHTRRLHPKVQRAG